MNCGIHRTAYRLRPGDEVLCRMPSLNTRPEDGTVCVAKPAVADRYTGEPTADGAEANLTRVIEPGIETTLP